MRPGEAARLIAIEAAAARLFAGHGHPAIAESPPLTEEAFGHLLDKGEALIAAVDGRAVGFALVERLDDMLWLCELSVDPDHGRRGIGAALLEAIVDLARRDGLAAVGLSTFRHVPFNAPFYARRGFAEIAPEAVGPSLHARFLAEVPEGAAPADRVLILRKT